MDDLLVIFHDQNATQAPLKVMCSDVTEENPSDGNYRQIRESAAKVPYKKDMLVVRTQVYGFCLHLP